MELGLIGLGRMGANPVRRLLRDGHRAVVYDIDPASVTRLVAEGVPAPVLSAALFGRFDSRGRDEFANQVLSAMRRHLGGHQEKGAPA